MNEILVAYDLMENFSETVNPETPLQEAHNLMRKTQLGFLPVVEPNGLNQLVGFLDWHVLDKLISAEMLRRKKDAGG